ncbi:MAG TPA: Uma2 family endonuclease [Bryobacteraceae bacterium]|jgi:Uma2 family endonuclease|nr:Uma2 family endonuclease [Bryobacteraceae bacterium]
MFPVEGATRAHSLIVTNVAGVFRTLLKQRSCEVYTSTLRLRVAATGLCAYPDVMVACGEPLFADDQADTLLNPVLIAEVPSKSTQDYDRGQKFQHYRTLASVMEYLAIAQEKVLIEYWSRQSDHRWLLTEFDDLSAAIRLDSIGIDLPVAEIYDKVTFASGPEAPDRVNSSNSGPDS